MYKNRNRTVAEGIHGIKSNHTTMKYFHWFIAYRENNKMDFKAIKNPKWAWAADPFLVEYLGKIYLFAELFLYGSERNGKIGYCEYTEGRFGDWIVTMDKHWHLSYPNVWVENGKLYMCPETSQMEEIAIYELVSFPDNWKKVKILVQNGHFVDTTFLDTENGRYLFTYHNKCETEKDALMQFALDENGIINGDGRIISEDKGNARPGGKFFKDNDSLIRVAQDCQSSYGAGLVFNRILSVWPEYAEEELYRIYPSDVSGDWSCKTVGVHTYNTLNGMEVIDLRYETSSLKESFAKQRIRKVFVDKYV